MKFDPRVPARLLLLQQWFGEGISRPLDQVEQDASRYITAGPQLSSGERFRIYHEQYWWRLLNVYQENFPLLLRIFGYEGFNEELVIPCLAQLPPQHWSLAHIGQQLVDWIDRHYYEEDRRLVLDAAKVDLAFVDAFIAGENKPLSLQQQAIETVKLRLQNYIHLFKLEGDLFQFRQELLKEEPEVWMDRSFPDLEPGGSFILFRNTQNSLTWRRLEAAEAVLLEAFAHGASLEEACEKLEDQDDALCQSAMEKIQKWLQQWTESGWLVPAPGKPPTSPA